MILNKYDRDIAARVGVLEMIAHDTLANMKNVKKFGKDKEKIKKFSIMEWQFKMIFSQLEKMMDFFEKEMTDAQYMNLVNISKRTIDLIEGKKI